MDALQFYHQQWRRYLLPSLIFLLIDAALLFAFDEWTFSKPLIALLSGLLGGFIRFLEAENISYEALHDTKIMFQYWASLIVGSVLGLFSYLLLLDGRLIKLVYPTAPTDSISQPSVFSTAICACFAGLLTRHIVAAARKRFEDD